jgi:predicted nucleic acid-binding protein
VIVLDASAVVDYVLWIGAAPRIASRISRTGEAIHAPYLLDIEVAHALRRYSLRGALSPERGAQALVDLADLRLRRYPHLPLLPRIWELRANLSAFDAAYVALAEALDAPLVTSDAALARAPGHRARVEVFAG